MLSCMFESLYLEFRTGQIVEVVPKPGFRWVIEGAGITEPPGKLPGDSSLVIGDPEGIRVRQYPRRLAPIRWEPKASRFQPPGRFAARWSR